ncbi:acyl-CoA reductase [Flavobacteriaceae bacterium]|nr:acyl-CoA reductase [Flavobacteriaceae bacterium]
MSLDKRKNAFVALGDFLSQFSNEEIVKKENILHNDLFYDAFNLQITRAREYNTWFTKDNVLFSIESWANALTLDNINQWLNSYSIPDTSDKTVAVIMAGNIPLVGFHDFLSVAISGNKLLAKLSSSDKHFIPLVAKYLEYVEPLFKGTFTFTEGKLEGFDAVIATGSNNTARYFEYYFGKHPHIIRQSRNAVAILDGNETHEQLEAMSDDIFRYFGLGCRSISKVFIPRGYDLDNIFRAVFKHQDIIDYDKYGNNYDYNKAVYLMSLFDIKENGFLMLKEDTSYSSPIASLFYEYYDDLNTLKEKITAEKDKIQCISTELDFEDAVKLGENQAPKLWNYADNVDTVKFLTSL